MIAKRSVARIGMRCEKGLVYLSKYIYIYIEELSDTNGLQDI